MAILTCILLISTKASLPLLLRMIRRVRCLFYKKCNVKENDYTPLPTEEDEVSKLDKETIDKGDEDESKTQDA